MATSAQSQETSKMPMRSVLAANEWLGAPCPGCAGTGGREVYHGMAEGPIYLDLCFKCQGTGKRHPEFWERCVWEGPSLDHADCPRFSDANPPLKGLCDGSGWALAVTEAKAMEAWGGMVNFEPLSKEPPNIMCCLVPEVGDPFVGYGESHLAAILDALKQVEP